MTTFLVCKQQKRYTEVTGREPMMSEYAMGFWQSKLRYVTQDQVLEVAHEYKKLPLDVIVIDFSIVKSKEIGLLITTTSQIQKQ